MASQQLKLKRQQTVDEDFNSRRSDWNKLHTTVENGIYKCKVCKGSRTSKFQLQMRSADEPMTT
jgi:DNA-directed RNA polymerase subunit M/transcription elongation factor TFIIS